MEPTPDGSYALSNEIMLRAVIVLFAISVGMVSLHICARLYLHRHRSSQLRRHRRTSHHLVFYIDPTDNPTSSPQANRRLDPYVLKSLPTFTFSSKSPADQVEENVPECAVCLSQFEEGERGRLLPRCGHRFHVDCIDMWFHSHSTCPLCRSKVGVDDPLPPARIEGGGDSPVEIVVELSESTRAEPALTLSDSATSSGLCADCRPGPSYPAGGSSSSSFGGMRRKGVEMIGGGVTVEIPARSTNFNFNNTDDSLSPVCQGYRSPTCRLLSLKRILSREKKPLPSPPAAPNSTSGIGSPAARRVVGNRGRASRVSDGQGSRLRLGQPWNLCRSSLNSSS